MVLVISLLPTMIFADGVQEPTAKTTVIALSDTIDVETIQNIEENVYVQAIDENGNATKLDCVVTINELPQTRSGSGKRYSMSVSTYAQIKNVAESDSYNDVNTACSATLTIVWNDGDFADNTIEELIGETNLQKGRIYGSRIRYGMSHTRYVKTLYLLIDDGDFDIYPNYTSENSFGNIHADYEIDLTGDDKYDIKICVEPPLIN